MVRYVQGQFEEVYEATIGAAFLVKTLSVEDADCQQVKTALEIWDTGTGRGMCS